MTLEKIREHLQKIRKNMEKLKKDEKKWMILERQAEDAAKLKIFRKSSLTIEDLEYLKGLNKEEIELLKQKSRRKEGENGPEEIPETPEKGQGD